MNKLSVVISAYNEEKKISECLESVKWADEIIVVNNSSTDKTEEIAKKYTSKIYNRPNNLMLNVNKNFGFSKASNEWILCLDADERVMPELKDEIKKRLLVEDKEISGFWIPRKNIIFGKWIKHTGWYPDLQLRLFKKGKGKFLQEHVHEMIKVDGQTEDLIEHLLHYNHESIAQFLNKHFNIYSGSEVESLTRKDYQFNYLDAVRFPIQEFLSRFFAREGYKDGFHGLMLSILMAFYHFIIFAKIWEKQGFKEIENKNILEDTKKEFKNSYKELLFWFYNEEVKKTKSLFKKSLLKVKNKFL